MNGGIFTMMDISASALRAERARMNVHANNLANAHTTRDEHGNINPYRRKQVYFRPGAPSITGSRTLGVEVSKIRPDYTSDFKRRYQPGHEDAGPDGYVTYPNIEVAVEMMDMMVAQRAFQANVTAFEAGKEVMRGALNLIA